MDATARLVRFLALVAVVCLLSGCLATGPGTEETTPAQDAFEAGLPDASTSAGCPTGVSFWGTAGPSSADQWAPDVVRIGYELPANASVLFVAYEDGTVLGETYASNSDAEYPIASDGDQVPLDAPLAGTHTVRVVAVADTNRNEGFDRTEDAVCERDGELVETGPETFDFDRFGTPAHDGS